MQDRTGQKSRLRSKLKQSRDLMDASMRQQVMIEIQVVMKRKLERLRRDKWKLENKHLVLFSYLSYGSEALTAFLFEEGWKHGDLMLAPKVLANPARMELRQVMGERDIEPGIWGIPEPKDSCEVLQPDSWPDIDLVVVPGLGYDLHGGRIGYGGGYYDRFAETLAAKCAMTGRRPLMASFVLPGQLQEEIPMDPRDLRLDLLITTEGIVHIE
ncbi:5-formyltetrahydrofolate cyclo-ligase [Paenibacillus pabuli]|uniref:5-formyltetrahydrofolate cyclo-ligase n=1 Tax=Paenibacillus pabuli TaxID=1472 RepID=UPI0007843DB5|nr:5-formyltetrahydrofolate cyclo-ligase [Paenibacillus pabuli]MEC0128534.1 5-formyltetrahydrofolate cyclo-ligase [Paenibacillus pabuli]